MILAGELGAFLLLGALALGVILAQILLLLLLAFAPVALVVAVFPGRGHDFFRAWLTKLAGYLARKVIYSLILAVILAVCQALDDATCNLGWLLAFVLQAAFLWAVFLQRNRLAADLLTATTGGSGEDGASRLQSLYYTTRLARMAALHRRSPTAAPARGRARHRRAPPPSPTQEATVNTPPPPRGVNAPEPGDDLGEPIAASEGPPAIQAHRRPTPMRSRHELAHRRSRRTRPLAGTAGWVGADCVARPPRGGDPERTLAILAEVRRVLRDDGTLWVLLQREQLPLAGELREEGWTQQPAPKWAERATRDAHGAAARSVPVHQAAPAFLS